MLITKKWSWNMAYSGKYVQIDSVSLIAIADMNTQ